jgi:hypothetical protein
LDGEVLGGAEIVFNWVGCGVHGLSRLGLGVEGGLGRKQT